LRALRLAHKIEFKLDPELRAAMASESHQLQKAILPRLREEILKWLRLDDPSLVFWEAFDLGLLNHMMPSLRTLLEGPKATLFFDLLRQGLRTADAAQDSYSLYTIFLYSWLTAQNESWSESLSTKIPDSVFQFMQSELGLHKIEAELFVQAVNLLKQLIKNPRPDQLRPRHREHLTTNRAFPLAMQLAENYHYLSQFETNQWIELVRAQTPRNHR
jgi:poly(A) polymerase